MGTGTKVTIVIGALVAAIFGYRFYKIQEKNDKIAFLLRDDMDPNTKKIFGDILRGMKDEDFNTIYSIVKKYGSWEQVKEGADMTALQLIAMKYGLTAGT